MNVLLSRIPLWAAVLPLAAYLCMIGWLHLRRRPVAVAGPLDAVLLAVGLSGLVAAGPLALLQPAVGISPWAAAILLLAFALVVACCVLAARPRLVVYNVSLDQLRPIVAEVAAALDPTARWAGETVALPGRGLQVHLDGRGLARTVTLVAVGSRTSAEAWIEFTRRMRRALRGLRVRSTVWAPMFLGLGLAVAAVAAWLVVRSWLPTADVPAATPEDAGASRPAA
jgi:hypothetical protein